MTPAAQQLRNAITQSGQSRYAIAKATGVEQSTLSRFMSGERTGMTLDTAHLLAQHLGYDLTLTPKKRTRSKGS
jgi:transcriptional regulator with XRE-family HTH domain